MVFETWMAYDLQKPLQPQVLNGSMFTQDNLGNKVGVILTDGGEPVGISGAVSGYIMRDDGATVAVIDGESSMNRAWITLPQAAYAVPGRIVIVIKITDGSTVTTVGACVVTVQKSTTGAIVDPGTIISDIDTLIATINAAIDYIPADLTNVMASIAPTFSSSTAYSIGDYVWHATSVDAPAVLYKFITNHAAGNWDGSQTVTAILSQDIKNIQHIYTPVSGNPTGNLAPEFGDTVTLSQVSQDANGQVSFTDRTLTIPNTAATTSKAGLMSAADKSKLNGITADYFGVCDTAAGTQTKSVTISGGPNAYTDGMTITIRFAHAQEYNGQPKLNVNLIGAKNIGISSSTAAGNGEWSAGDILTFVYYAASDIFVIVNGQHGTGSTYGKALIDESADGSTDVVKALSSRVFYNNYIKNVIVGANVYDPNETYALGAIVRYSGRAYRCRTAISTPEVWTIAHWELLPALQTQINRTRFQRIDAEETSPWKAIGGMEANQGLRVVRFQGAVAWAAQQYSSGIAFGEADTHGYIGIGYSGTSEGLVAFAGGSTTNSTDAAPDWKWDIKGEKNAHYLLSKTCANDGGEIPASDLLNTQNTTGSVYYRKAGIMVTINFDIVVMKDNYFEQEAYTTIFTMPSGHRPPRAQCFGTFTHTGTPVLVYVNSDGTVQLYPPTTTLGIGDQVTISMCYMQAL